MKDLYPAIYRKAWAVILNENEELATESDNRMWKVILVMLLLLIFGPFVLEIRFSTYFFPVISLTDFVLYSWTWVYSVIGYSTNGFITLPFYRVYQPGSLHTFLPFLFLVVLVGYQLGAVSRKDAIRAGLVSIFPSLLVLFMNVFLSIFVPFGSTIIVPIPLPIASILGIMMLRRTPYPQGEDQWLSNE